MNDACGMCGMQRHQDVRGYLTRTFLGQAALRLNQLLHVWAIHVFHDEIVQTFFATDLETLDDVLMVKCGCGCRPRFESDANWLRPASVGTAP